MVSPDRKRRAVDRAQKDLGVSERRACQTLGQSRSTQRYRARLPKKDAGLVAQLHRISKEHPRHGYRMVTWLLRSEGWDVNRKRVQRLWRQEGLKVPRKTRKKRSRGNSENGTQRKSAERVNHVWSYDFVHDQTEDGRPLKWLPVMDEYSRENLALEVGRGMKGADVVEVLDRLVEERGAREYIRSDNGPEFVSKVVCEWIEKRGFKTLFIDPGSPWQNAYVESFNSRLRDELLNVEIFSTLAEARVLGNEHRSYYNEKRPHSSLGGKSPRVYAAHCSVPVGATPLPTPNNGSENPEPNLS
jgi:putative transposase